MELTIFYCKNVFQKEISGRQKMPPPYVAREGQAAFPGDFSFLSLKQEMDICFYGRGWP